MSLQIAEPGTLRLVDQVSTRRALFRGIGSVGLSAAAISILGGCESMAAGTDATMADTDVLNVALGLEHEAIGAYQIGAESGLLQEPVLQVAVLFQSHHKEHRDALASAIQKMGGTAVEPKSIDEYAKALNAASLKDQAGVLDLAARLELGAANAYLGVIPAFSDRGLSQVAARLASDETMHWTMLANALGQSLPQKALSFGA